MMIDKEYVDVDNMIKNTIALGKTKLSEEGRESRDSRGGI